MLEEHIAAFKDAFGGLFADAHSAEKVTAAVSVVAGSGAVVFGLTSNDIAAIVGATVAVTALFANVSISIYFKNKYLKFLEESVKEDVTPNIMKNMCSVCPMVKEASKVGL